MEYITLLWGLIGLLAVLLCGLIMICLLAMPVLCCLYLPDERKLRILKDKFKFLGARVQDMRDIFLKVRRGKKKNLDKKLGAWIDEAHELIRKAECLIRQVEGWGVFFISAKVTWEVDKLVDELEIHDKKGGKLLIRAMSEVRVPCGGHYLPVKEVVGKSALRTLDQLEILLQNDKVRRIAICGEKGVGKSFIMKHLHNSALNQNQVEKFDHVFWVTLEGQSTTQHKQDAIGTAINCDLNSDDALNVRATKLSDSLSSLVSCALFVDGVGADFSFNQVGIPMYVEGNSCKLIVTTSLAMENSLLDPFEAVKVDPLLEEEAYQLFLHEANVGEGSDSSLGGISRLLADGCCGVPHMIVKWATCMFGVDDLCEWRNALFELGLEMGNKFPCEGMIHQLKCDSRKLRRNVLPSSYALG